jgi:hypothetical protein
MAGLHTVNKLGVKVKTCYRCAAVQTDPKPFNTVVSVVNAWPSQQTEQIIEKRYFRAVSITTATEPWLFLLKFHTVRLTRNVETARSTGMVEKLPQQHGASSFRELCFLLTPNGKSGIKKALCQIGDWEE